MTAKSKKGQAPNSRGLYRRSRELADVILTVLAVYADMVMSTRQVFYQCVSRGAIPNTDRLPFLFGGGE